MKIKIAMIVLVVCGTNSVQKINAADIPNQEIRDAIFSLVSSYNLLDNKLERHEHRERALGEVIKRALQSLQKGQKVYEPMKGIFSRLDERVSQIETMLIAQEEKYNIQTDKLGEALETIFKWMTEKTACEETKPVAVAQDNTGPSNKEIMMALEKLSNNVKELSKSSKTVLERTEEIVTSKQSSTDEAISKLEDKLTNFYVTGVTTLPEPKNTDFENNVTKYLSKIVTTVDALRVPAIKDEPKGLLQKDREYIQGLTDNTLNAIREMKLDVLIASDKVLDKTASRVKDSNEMINNSLSKLLKTVTESSNYVEQFYDDFNKSYKVLNESLEVFNKFDKILLATSDYILETQRKVEYGGREILIKVGELIHLENADLNETLSKRFDDVESSINNNHLEALQNLSSTMESEISHVWRQIEIMHSEISHSKDSLDKLQGQTETYVNGTFTTMDSMEGKVSQITGRMAEVDANLNYLLGRLSLVTQEFNHIKSGLGNALDQIRSSFQTVQEKIKDVGPGPHDIPRDEYETDINLLPPP